MTLSEVVSALDAEIGKLQEARRLLSAVGNVAKREPDGAAEGKRRGRPPRAKKATVKSAGKRTMSEAGRARIAAAQKKRWAAKKRAANVQPAAPVAELLRAVLASKVLPTDPG